MENQTNIFTPELPSRRVSFNFSHNSHLDHIANLVFNQGHAAYEAPTPELLSCIVKRSSGYVLDVGANIGLFSLLAAATNPAIKVCAFEPLEKVAALLERNLLLNPDLIGRINLYRLGLSSTEGNVDFYETINQHGLVSTSSSLESSHAINTGAAYNKESIRTERLDFWAARLRSESISFIKIDVEGHEYAVIEGGRQTIERCRPMMTIEVLGTSRLDSIKTFLFECEYVDFVITPSGLRQSSSLSYHADGWNHLLCPSEKLVNLFSICRELKLKLDIV